MVYIYMCVCVCVCVCGVCVCVCVTQYFIIIILYMLVLLILDFLDYYDDTIGMQSIGISMNKYSPRFQILDEEVIVRKCTLKTGQKLGAMDPRKICSGPSTWASRTWFSPLRSVPSFKSAARRLEKCSYVS